MVSRRSVAGGFEGFHVGQEGRRAGGVRSSQKRRPCRMTAIVNHPGFSRVSTFMQNLRYAFRRLITEPGFAFVVVLAIGLGIGMNTTVFTLVNAVLLRGLPYDSSDELVVAESFELQERDGRGVSWPDYQDWRRETKSFRGLAAMAGQPFNVSGEPGAPERISGMRLTPNAFSLLGQQMFLGRDFVEEIGRAPGRER